MSRLAGWCSDNNLSLNVEKMKEIVVDFRRVHTLHAPLTINGATVERASSRHVHKSLRSKSKSSLKSLFYLLATVLSAY